MLNLYITKPDDVILCNDEFFISKTYKKVMDDLNILQEISKLEGAEIKGSNLVSKFTGEILHLNSLSTGCKTLLNVLEFPDKVFFIGECGNEVLEKLYSLKNASLYASNIYLPLNNIENSIVVHADLEKIEFMDTDSLYDWWCKYYEN